MKRAVLLAAAVLAGAACSDPQAGESTAGISLVPLATLGGSMEESSPHPSARISVRTSDGDTSYWASPTYELGVLHGYGPDGTIRSRLGGPGEGPGELGGLRQFSVQWVDDLAFVTTGNSRRLTIFDERADTSHVETLPWRVLHVSPTPAGEIVLVPWGEFQAPTVRRRTGELESVLLPSDLAQVMVPFVALGRAEAPRVAWLADILSGTVYSVREDLTAEYRFSVANPDSASGPTWPLISSLAEHDGVLWIGTVRPVVEVPSDGALRVEMSDSIFDTYILALDVATGERLGSYRAPQVLRPVWSESGVFYSDVIETEIGDTRVVVYEAVLGGNGAR